MYVCKQIIIKNTGLFYSRVHKNTDANKSFTASENMNKFGIAFLFLICYYHLPAFTCHVLCTVTHTDCKVTPAATFLLTKQTVHLFHIASHESDSVFYILTAHSNLPCSSCKDPTTTSSYHELSAFSFLTTDAQM